MKPTEISFEFDCVKLEAINICMKEKNTELKTELEAFMEQLYKKYVPVAVRDFIEKKEEMSVPDTLKQTRRNVSLRRAISSDKNEGEANTREDVQNGTDSEN